MEGKIIKCINSFVMTKGRRIRTDLLVGYSQQKGYTDWQTDKGKERADNHSVEIYYGFGTSIKTHYIHCKSEDEADQIMNELDIIIQNINNILSKLFFIKKKILYIKNKKNKKYK